MSVQLEPAELSFTRPFTREVSETLRLHNPNQDAVAFKVKTTAPKQYCVRPNSGRIAAGASVEVQVLLQAMKEDPPLDIKCRDKFLVQSVAIDVGIDENVNVHDVWQHIEQTARSSIQEKKIRVVYLSEGQTANDVDSSFISQRSPSPTQAHTPRTPQVDRTLPQQDSQDEKPILNSVADTMPSREELQKMLNEAKATITGFEESAANQGLRQRNVGASRTQESTTTGTPGVQPTASGVPVQYVAVLCLLCFLIAYLLF